MPKRACPQCNVLCDQRDFRCGCGYDFAAADSALRLKALEGAKATAASAPPPPASPAGGSAPGRSAFPVARILVHLAWIFIVAAGGIAGWRAFRTDPQTPPEIARPRLPASQPLPASPGTVSHPLRDPVLIVKMAGESSPPVFVGDGRGGGCVAWIEPRGSKGSVVLAQRILSTGELAWKGDRGLMLSRGEGVRRDLVAIADAGQGLLLGWTESRGSTPSIMVQRLTWEGVEGWKPGGVEPGTFSKGQERARLVRERSGALLVFWREPAGEGAEVFAQRLSAQGKPEWPPNGLPVPGATGRIEFLEAIPDPGGGNALVWTLADAPYLRALRLGADGKPVWAAAATVPAIEAPVHWLAAQQGAGGAFWIVWRCGDERPSRFRAQRIAADSGTGGGAIDLGRVTLGADATCATLAAASGPVLLLAWTERDVAGAGSARVQRAASGKCTWPLEGLTALRGVSDARRVACWGDGAPKGPFLAAIGDATGNGRIWAVRMEGEVDFAWRADCGAFAGMSGVPDWLVLEGDGKNGGIAVWRASAGPGFSGIAVQRIAKDGTVGVWDAAK